jgi:hypothetical protein
MASVILLLFALAGGSYIVGTMVKNGTFDIHDLPKSYWFSAMGYLLLIILVLLNRAYIAFILYVVVSIIMFMLGKKFGKESEPDDGFGDEGNPVHIEEDFRIPPSMIIHENVEKDTDDMGEYHEE